MNYFALIGDIIDSKKIDNRYQVQKNIRNLLK
ncbi:hypothetical protein Si026_01257 [Streptococcus infantarius subsp. infantarius]|nr:hypothetical protein [Streptococcus infantarius subsp. infantarius]